jgi:polysaccharide deacetylase family protein (PEP-CTERM system associated)
LRELRATIFCIDYLGLPSPIIVNVRDDNQHSTPGRVRHHFTVDVEEHFQVSAMEPYVPRSQWDAMPSRVDRNTRILLELLAKHDAKGTFFTLGWVAKRQRSLVADIVAAGHEMASHGYGHERVTTLTPAQFRESVRDSKAILEDITGSPVLGYRAPSFSIVRGGEWALDILIEEGYRYDSSLFPVIRSGYGYRGGERDHHVLSRPVGQLDEVPPVTLKVGAAVLPAAGGAYLRLLPPVLVEAAVASAERRGEAATLYIHPWEVDPEQPRIDVSLKTRIRHYGGLRRTSQRLERLLKRFKFQPISATLGFERRVQQNDARRSSSARS